jgi:hypothetical protein
MNQPLAKRERQRGSPQRFRSRDKRASAAEAIKRSFELQTELGADLWPAAFAGRLWAIMLNPTFPGVVDFYVVTG